MSWRIRISTKAENSFHKLDNDTRTRIRKELILFGERNVSARCGDIQPLTGRLKGLYRLRTGCCRIVFACFDDSRTIAIVYVTLIRANPKAV